MKLINVLEICFLFDVICGDKIIRIESILEEHLFENYNRIVLPRLNSSKPIQVLLESYLADLSNLREADNVLETYVYFHLEWTDELLTWNISEYAIKELSVALNKIWLPDVFMINGLGQSRYLPVQDTLVHVSHEGRVSWWPGGNIKTKCKVNISKYPFDSQLCKLLLEPWKLSAEEQIFEVFHSAEYDLLGEFDENAGWEVTSLSQVAFVGEFYGHYKMAHYEYCIYLRRRSVYHILNIISPVVLLSFINMCSYFIPPSSGEKMSVCVSIFLSFAVYVTIINNELPKTANGFCYFGLYLFTQLFISGCTIVLSALVLHIYHNEEKCSLPCPCSKRKGLPRDGANDYDGSNSIPVKELVNVANNRAFALKLDSLFLKMCLTLNVASLIVFLTLSNT